MDENQIFVVVSGDFKSAGRLYEAHVFYAGPDNPDKIKAACEEAQQWAEGEASDLCKWEIQQYRNFTGHELIMLVPADVTVSGPEEGAEVVTDRSGLRWRPFVRIPAHGNLRAERREQILKDGAIPVVRLSFGVDEEDVPVEVAQAWLILSYTAAIAVKAAQPGRIDLYTVGETVFGPQGPDGRSKILGAHGWSSI